jgi:ABC-type sugar transport system substrate-binding protein
MKNKTLLAITTLVVLSMVLSACASAQATSAPQPAVQPVASAAEKLCAGKEIVFVTNLGAHPWWTPNLQGMKDAAAEVGATLTIAGPQGYDTAAQVTAMDQVIAQNPAGIIVGVLDAPAVTDVTTKAIKAGIPTVWIATGGPSPIPLEALNPNEDEIGPGYADKMNEALGGKGGKVGVSMQVANSAILTRVDGIKKRVAEKYPNIELLPEFPMGGSDDEATKAISAFLQANPDLSGLIVTSGHGAALLTALRETGALDRIKNGTLKVVASDVTTMDVVNAAKDGTFYAVLQQNLYAEGYTAVHDLCLFNISPNAYVKNMLANGNITNPKWVNVGYFWVDAKNADLMGAMFK